MGRAISRSDDLTPINLSLKRITVVISRIQGFSDSLYYRIGGPKLVIVILLVLLSSRLIELPWLEATSFTVLVLYVGYGIQNYIRSSRLASANELAAAACKRQAIYFENALETQRGRFAAIEGFLPGLIFERQANADGTYSFPFFAGSLLAVLGLTIDEVEREPGRLFGCIHRDDREQREKLISLSILAKASYCVTFRVITPSDELIWVKCTGTCHISQTGIAVWTTLWTDITEHHQAFQLAEEASRQHSDLLANVSHELRTPINAILGFNELLAEREIAAEERRYVDRTNEAASILLQLTNQILAFTKCINATNSSPKVAFRLSDVIQGAIDLNIPSAAKKSISIKTCVAPDVPMMLRGDPDKLRQVLTNLLSNSVKFAPSGEISVWVTRISHEASSVRLRLAIVDAGIGIAEDALAKLFKRYSQADASTSWLYGGTGLGLSICAELVKQMGGSIGATSTVGVGSTFWVELTKEIDSSEPKAVRERTPPRMGILKGVRILLADDFEPGRELVAEFLHSFGCSVDTVENGEAAVRAASTHTYDLILMDVRMPVMDGLAATSKIRRAHSDQPRVPIVALTAGALHSDATRCLAAGMDTHLVKPISRTQIYETLVRYLGERDFASDPCVNRSVLSGIEQQLGRSKVVEYLELFLRDVRSGTQRIISSSDRSEIEDVAHRLAGSAGQLGFERLLDASRSLMRLAAQDASVDLRPYIEKIQEAADGALKRGTAVIEEMRGRASAYAP